MKVLIAGGSGFIGQNLSIFFSKKNFFTVSTYFKHKPSFKNKNLKFVKIDFRSKKNTLKFVKNFDVVIICAGYVLNQQAINKKNINRKILDHIKINKNIIDACKMNKIHKVIYLSSALGYPSSKFKLTENIFFKGKVPKRHLFVGNMYRSLEKYLYKSLLNFIILRPGEVYGEYDNFKINSANSIAKYFNYLVLKKKKIIYVSNAILSQKSFIYIEELCKVISYFVKLKKNYNTSFNVANSETKSILDIINIILEMKKLKIQKIIDKQEIKSNKYLRILSTKKLSKIYKIKIRSKLRINIPRVLKFLKYNY